MNPMTHAEALKALFVEGADLDLTDRHAAQYALGLAGRIERAAQELIGSMVDGNDAMRAVCDEPPFSDEPFAADIARTIAARKTMGYKVGDTIRLLKGHWAVDEGSCPSGTTAQLVEARTDGSFSCSPIPGYGLGFVFSPDGYGPGEVERVDTAIPVATPAEDAALDEIEARQVEAAHPAPNFAPLDMVSFAADSLGLKKGA